MIFSMVCLLVSYGESNRFERTLTGEDVDYEMLLEYLLYLTSQQDRTASTPVRFLH